MAHLGYATHPIAQFVIASTQADWTETNTDSLPLCPSEFRHRTALRFADISYGPLRRVVQRVVNRVDAANARAINTVIFDLGNVLIRWDPRNLYRKLFGEQTEAMERFLTEVCHPEWNERQDAGRTWQEAIDEAIARHPQHEDLIRAYRLRWDEMLDGAILESVAVLQQLRDNGTRLLALTNWSRETFPVALERYDFLHWFEGILVSGEVGLIKPDPAIFRLLISRFEVEVSRAIFIDDSLRNVDGARQVGLPAIHFEDAGKLRRDLRALGLAV